MWSFILCYGLVFLMFVRYSVDVVTHNHFE